MIKMSTTTPNTCSPFITTPALRCGLYARYSGEDQKESSNEDQIRECREYADRKGWVVRDDCIFADSAKTGQTVGGRDGLERLVHLTEQTEKPFDILLMFHTSRMGRNVADVHKLKAWFEFCEIGLVFVADDMDSRTSSFDTMFAFKSVGDQQYSRDLRAHVRKAQNGRFIDGHFGGGGVAYGYRTKVHENLNERGPYGRYKVDFVDLEIDAAEAAVVIQMYEWYAGGLSYGGIAKRLNAEGVKPPQAPRLRSVPSWSKGAVVAMLRNESYIGIFRRNMSYERYNPLTGKRVRKYRPESEWLTKEMPHLRIIPQELWDRVCERRKFRSKYAKQVGGMERKPLARTYLFSGVLFCGACDHKMFIVGPAPSAYGCSDYSERGTCENGLKVRQQALETELLTALARNLSDERFREELIAELKVQISEKVEKLSQRSGEAASKLAELTRERAELKKKANMLAEAIAQVGLSPTLACKLEEYDGRLRTIAASERELAAAPSPAIRHFEDWEIRSFVEAHSAQFAELLTGDRARAKEEIRKRVSHLTLTPIRTESANYYVVTGDVALFGAEESAMQSKQGELVGLHYTFPLRVEVAAARTYRRREKPQIAATQLYGTLPGLAGHQDCQQGHAVETRSLTLVPKTGKEDVSPPARSTSGPEVPAAPMCLMLPAPAAENPAAWPRIG